MISVMLYGRHILRVLVIVITIIVGVGERFIREFMYFMVTLLLVIRFVAVVYHLVQILLLVLVLLLLLLLQLLLQLLLFLF